MITIKSNEQINYLTSACEVVKQAFEVIEKELKAGMTTKELDKIAENFILSKGAIPSFKGYNGFSGSACISINEQVIHGIPGSRKIKNGDIVSVDIGAFKNGYHGDAARTYAIGDVSPEVSKLIDVTRESFFEGMKFAKVGYRLFDISNAIEEFVLNNGYTVVKEFTGHGIGALLHEDPQIPNYKPKFRKSGFVNPRLATGMTFAIEPMVNMGKRHISILSDGWTVVTLDKSLSAHYENTIVITDNGPLMLTL